MGKIDDPQNPEHKRESGSNNKQYHPLAEAVDEDKQVELDAHRYPLSHSLI